MEITARVRLSSRFAAELLAELKYTFQVFLLTLPVASIQVRHKRINPKRAEQGDR